MSPKAATALRYFETLRHLRPVQLTNRLARKLRPVSIDRSPAPPLRPRNRPPVPPIDHAVNLSGPDTVLLTNRPGRIADATSWNDPGQPKLWLYNLHYFDWMSGERDTAQRRWERELIVRWIAENPVGKGNGWEPYPVSLRIVNWAKWLFEGNSPPDGMLLSLALQLRTLERTLEWHLLGNHLLANAKAMFIGGCLFGATEGDRWLALGDRLLSEQWRVQILADGGHEERSTMYHALVLEDVLDCVNIARAVGLDHLRAAREGSHLSTRMLRWLATMTHPDGSMALFNDSAPGIAATLGQLAHYAALLGLGSPPEMPDGLIELRETGYLRAQVGVAVLLIDWAPIEPRHQPGHAHADTLNFELSLEGTPVLVSSGTSTYEIGPQRAWERSTAAHNCVVVDGLDSSDVWSGFRVGRRANVTERSFEAGPPFSLTATHDGYRFLAGSPRVSRTWHLAANKLTITDQLIPARKHLATAWLHLSHRLKVEVSCQRARVFGAPCGLVEIFTSTPVTTALTTRSLGFNHLVEGPSLTYPLRRGHGRVEIMWGYPSDTGKSSD